MQIIGRAWKYGDNINTDVIFPGKYTYTVTERAEIARHALEDLDPTFAANVQPRRRDRGRAQLWLRVEP
jgi:3-isopropylmalate/(R)-2-methylmalate dehydratase small subunit